MRRVLSAYEKTTGYHINDVDINISVDELVQIFTPYEGDIRMIMRYDVDEEKAEILKPYTGEVYNFDLYDYDVGAYSS